MKAATWFVRLLVLLSILGIAQFLFAQGTDLGTITGSVTDGSGAVVPNAKVVILDLSTKTSRETKTNNQGVYRVFGLSGGRYLVTISQVGMGTVNVNGVEVRGSDVVTADAQLKVASATETVSVSADAPLINTDDQTISDTIPSRAIIDLPRRCRQYLKCPRPDLDFVPFGQEPGRLYLFTVDEGAVPAAVDQEGPIGRGYHARVAAGHFVARQNDVALGQPTDRNRPPTQCPSTITVREHQG